MKIDIINSFKESFNYAANTNSAITLTSIIDLGGADYNLPNNSIVVIQSGGFINTADTPVTLNLNNAKVIGDINDIISKFNAGLNKGAITISGVAKGSYKYDKTNNKPLWYDGTAWVDATGTPV